MGITVPNKVKLSDEVIERFEALVKQLEDFADEHKIALLVRYSTARHFAVDDNGIQAEGSGTTLTSNVPYGDLDTLLLSILATKMATSEVNTPMKLMSAMHEAMSQVSSAVVAVSEARITDNNDGTFT